MQGRIVLSTREVSYCAHFRLYRFRSRHIMYQATISAREFQRHGQVSIDTAQFPNLIQVLPCRGSEKLPPLP